MLSVLCDLQMAWVVSVLSFMCLMKVRNRRGCCRNVLPICERNVDNFSLSMFFSISCAFIRVICSRKYFLLWLKRMSCKATSKKLTKPNWNILLLSVYLADLSKRKGGKICFLPSLCSPFVSFFAHLCHLSVSLPPQSHNPVGFGELAQTEVILNGAKEKVCTITQRSTSIMDKRR